MPMNRLFYGDNLDVLRQRQHFPDASVDLVYLDPPFNSKRDYNVLYAEDDARESEAQIRAFEDCWHWDHAAESAYNELTTSGEIQDRLARLIEAMRAAIGSNDMMAYLVMMALRLIELRRVLRPAGSIYLHCDPTASHYLKIVMDATFGAENFFSEIVWRRYGAHGDAKRYGAVHDILLYYGRTRGAKFNKQFVPYTAEYAEDRFRLVDEAGRRYQEQNLSSPNPRPNLTYPYTASNGVTYQPHPNGWKCDEERMRLLDSEGRLHFPKDPTGRLRLKMYFDESDGVAVQDVWTDIILPASSKERLGYPTQKPVALLERIIAASSDPGDIVLDPFCGCGTTVHAAQKLGREWIGIDVTHLAISLIRDRLKTAFPGIAFSVKGEPVDIDGARELAAQDKYQFQWWALHLIGARPVGDVVGREGKKGKDRGIDGIIRFRDDKRVDTTERIIVSVKGGEQIGPAMVRELIGTIGNHKAAMGVLLTMQEPTAAMRREAAEAGFWNSRAMGGREYPRIQLVTVEDAFAGKGVEYPASLDVTLPQARAERGPQAVRGQKAMPRPAESVPLTLPGMETLLPGMDARR